MDGAELMVTPGQIESAIARVKDQRSFLRELLGGALGWPVDESAHSLDDISFGLTEAELNAEGLSKHLVDGQVYQIQRLHKNQPWGVFILEFKNQDLVSSGRGMTGPLRKLLSRLVSNRRKEPSIPSWKRDNLLFICTYRYTHYRWAYFKAPKDSSKNSPLTTFGWSPDSPNRTACEFNLPPLEWPADENNIEKWSAQWASAFDVEAVTKEFFRVYHSVFEYVEKAITGYGRDKDGKRLFTQKLFNRLMFVAFIQKKGWLKFGGSADYLNSLWKDYEAKGGDSFYTGRLIPLFFSGLSSPNEVNQTGINRGGVLRDVYGDVPYLNGGLFEREGDDNDDSIKIPDKCFEKIFDELINRWNFTVTENTPLDIEVAVDPEMMGKVFEELVTGRHESGSYYTPKPVVSFMCREALKGYLGNAIPSEPEKAIGHFVDDHDPEGLKNPETVLAALRNVKVLDPACGSGAYLVGMLHELLDLRHALFVVKKLDSKTVYDRKLEIIENNLYGVDLDPFAVNIARLRLWLSLAVDFDKKDKDDKVPPLPNLDFKIEVGDSLTAPNLENEFEKGALRGFLENAVSDYKELKDRYMTAHHGEKLTLRDKINTKRNEISDWAHHTNITGFDWTVEFAEVFLPRNRVTATLDGGFGFVNEAKKQQSLTEETGGSPGGFDIVVANPPYVRQELIKELKPALKRAYGDLFSGTADLYCYFYIRALQLLRPGGMLSFISSNKWFRAGYGEKLRAHISGACAIHSITDFGDLPVFTGATAYPMIFIARKGKDDKIAPMFTQVKSLEPPYPDIPAVVKEAGYKLTHEAINGAEWRLADMETISRLKKMESAGVPLGEYVKGKMFRGILTGFNEAFVIDGEKRAELIAEDPKSAEIIKPLAVGRDIRKWRIEKKDKWLIFSYQGIEIDNYPAIKKHFLRWKKELTPKMTGKEQYGRAKGSYKWYQIQTAVAYEKEFEKPKIVWGNMGLEPRFTLSVAPLYVMAPANVISCNDLFLLGLLNSQVSSRYFNDISIQRGGGYLEFKPIYVNKFPIPRASASDRAAIEKLVQKCLDARGVGCETWEREIDEIVARLYGL
jgi:hypothetical protein